MSKSNGSEMKFGVTQAKKELGVKTEHAARTKLRAAKVKKSGKSYGWATRDAMLKAIKPAISKAA